MKSAVISSFISLFIFGSCSSSEVEPVEDNLFVSCETISSLADGIQSQVEVRSSIEWAAFPSDNENWIQITPNCGGAGTFNLTITVSPNKDYQKREGNITILAGQQRKYISVSQEAAEKPVVTITCPLPGYELVWNDEFDEPGVLHGDWTYEVQRDHWVNNELQNYVKETSPNGREVASVQDGILSINCFKENGKIYSGRVYGHRNVGFRYGYVEASINLPSGKGTWPAFWMMPVHFTSWPDDGEIDIMEEVGVDKNRVSSSIHCKAYYHSIGTQKTHEMYLAGAEGEFHTYALEWTPDYIQTYVDGKKQLYFENDKKNDKKTWPFNTAFYPILNLAWGGDWGGYAGVDETKLPVSLKVDYVRVFQKKK